MNFSKLAFHLFDPCTVYNDVYFRFTYLHSVIGCSSFAQSEGRLSPKVEEEDEGKEKVDAGAVYIELHTRVQELEDKMKDSEQERMELSHRNMALQNFLTVARKEIANLEERLLPEMRSQVRRMVGQLVAPENQECYCMYVYVIQAFLTAGGTAFRDSATSLT